MKLANPMEPFGPVMVPAARIRDDEDQLEAITRPADLDRPWLGDPRAQCVSGICHGGTCMRADCPNSDKQDAARNFESPAADEINDLGHSLVLWVGVLILCVMLPSLVLRISWADVISLLSAIGDAVMWGVR